MRGDITLNIVKMCSRTCVFFKFFQEISPYVYFFQF